MARTIAGQLAGKPDFVTAAFERILDRKPTAQEARESTKYLAEQTALYQDSSKLTAFKTGPDSLVKPSSDPAQRARESLTHVLLNHNDFVAIR